MRELSPWITLVPFSDHNELQIVPQAFMKEIWLKVSWKTHVIDYIVAHCLINIPDDLKHIIGTELVRAKCVRPAEQT